MNKFFIFIIGLVWITAVTATEINGVSLLPVTIDLHDKEALQRGARMYMNYCSGCHSLQYLRYNRMAEDLGLTTFDGAVDENLLLNNLIFTHAQIYDPIKISMPPIDARQWFGIMPPDLSLVARARGASWLYTYLKSFYADDSRPFGSNNLLFPLVAMPNVLEPLSGKVVALKSPQNSKNTATPSLMQVEKGTMNNLEFNSALQDLITFLVYTSEPSRLLRYRLGGFVLVFLLLFTVVIYRLKKAYWKKIL